MPIITFFRTLRGKLILTYTLVTVLALLALEIILFLMFFVFARSMNRDTLSYLSDVISVLSPQARSYLQSGSRDLEGLQSWLEATYDSGYASLPPQDLFDNPAALIVKTEPIYIIAPDKTILAVVPRSSTSLAGSLYSLPASVIQSQNILDNALQLNLQSGNISTLTPDGNYLMAVPVQQRLGDGPLAAVIILTVKAPTAEMSKWWPVILGIVPITGFILLLTVAPFGLLFGFIMSQGLTRRLKSLTLAADAWGEGNFSVQPQDLSKDEIGYLGMRLRQMAEQIQGLLQAQQELALLEERNRLARELHDTVKQQTFATLMQIRAAKNLLDRDPSLARQRLNDAEDLIKTSQQEMGLILSALRPVNLEGYHLAEALSHYLTTWSRHSSITADLHVENEQALTLVIEQTLLRVAQEALSNVARHSHASSVRVRLTFEADHVILCISDNGVGFDSHATGGFGQQSMRDRMIAIRGSLIIEAAPARGSTITASAPIFHQER